MAISNLKTISQLPEISADNFFSNSYIGVSVPAAYDDADRTAIYASKKISKREFGNAMVNQVTSYLADNNGIREGVNVTNILSTFNKLTGGPDFMIANPDLEFQSAPKSDETISDYFDNKNQKKVVNLETLKSYTNSSMSPAVGENFGFVASLSSENLDEVVKYNLYKIVKQEDKYVTDGTYNYGLTQDIGKDVSENQFVFHIEPGQKESNVWVVPATGIFTCYGWIDEVQTEKVSNESRWVALMGRKQFSDGDFRWVILQIQPFIANNYLSYVGFTFPVQAGMELKIKTGFTTGSNSGMYFKSQSSLANHVANAFLGGIYTNLSIGTNVEGEFANVGKESEVLNALSALSSHVNLLQTSADINVDMDDSQQEQIKDLSTQLDSLDIDAISAAATIISNAIDSLSDVLPVKVNYFDTKSTRNILTADIFFGYGSSYGCDKSIQTYNGAMSLPAEFITWDRNYSVLHNIEHTASHKAYYAPPSFLEIVQDGIYQGERGTVEKAYVDSTRITPGAIFSDGKYYYYRVSKNSTVRIALVEDTVNRTGAYKFCWLLVKTDGSFNNTEVVKLLDQGESNDYHMNGNFITIPLIADSILMFGFYMREKFNPSTPAKFGWIDYVSGVNISSRSSGYDKFTRILDNEAYDRGVGTYKYFDSAGNSGTQVRYTYRLDADGNSTSMNRIFSNNKSDTNKYYLGDTSFDRIATIVELP